MSVLATDRQICTEKEKIDRQNKLSQSIGDTEIIYYDEESGGYKSKFGSDLPQVTIYECI